MVLVTAGVISEKSNVIAEIDKLYKTFVRGLVEEKSVRNI
jgi:hypothetical protein